MSATPPTLPFGPAGLQYASLDDYQAAMASGFTAEDMADVGVGVDIDRTVDPVAEAESMAAAEAAQAAAPASPDAPDAPAAEAPPAAAAEVTPPDATPDGLANNWRLTADGDPVKQQAFAMLKANPKLALAEAEALAKKALGLDKALTQDPAAGTPPAESDPEPDPLTDLQAELAEVRAQLATARTEFNDEAASTLEARKDELLVALAKAQMTAEQRQSEAVAEQFAASRERVAQQFGDHYQAGTPFVATMGEVETELRSVGDPRVNAQNFPEVVAAIAALRSGFTRQADGRWAAPGAAPAPVATPPRPSSAPQAPPQAHAAPIAPGSARTDSAPPAPPAPVDLAEWRRLHGVSEL